MRNIVRKKYISETKEMEYRDSKRFFIKSMDLYFYTHESTKFHDKIKDDFCKNNKIKLLRIPFWYFYNEKYKTFLSNNIR